MFHKNKQKNRDGQYVVPKAKQLCSAVLIQIILLIRSNYSTPDPPLVVADNSPFADLSLKISSSASMMP